METYKQIWTYSVSGFIIEIMITHNIIGGVVQKQSNAMVDVHYVVDVPEDMVGWSTQIDQDTGEEFFRKTMICFESDVWTHDRCKKYGLKLIKDITENKNALEPRNKEIN